MIGKDWEGGSWAGIGIGEEECVHNVLYIYTLCQYQSAK
jgi:hypothetical protein